MTSAGDIIQVSMGLHNIGRGFVELHHKSCDVRLPRLPPSTEKRHELSTALTHISALILMIWFGRRLWGDVFRQSNREDHLRACSIPVKTDDIIQ
jgi:hypothetical protein